MAEINQTQDRREEARRALEGEAWRARRTQQEQDIARRREEARRAMEAPRHRQKREGRESARQEQQRAAQAATAAAAQTETEKRAALAAAETNAREAAAKQTQRFETIKFSGQRIEELKKSSPNLNPLRTLKTDLAQAVREEGMTLSKIAAAGGGEAAPAPASTKRSIWLPVLLLFLLAGGGFYYYWTVSRQPPGTGSAAALKPLVLAEQNVAVEVTGLENPAAVRGKLISQSAGPGPDQTTIRNLYLTLNQQPLFFSEVYRLTGLNLPEGLRRHLTEEYMYGVYFSGAETGNFLILQTTFFDRTWSALWEWEPQLLIDMLPLIRGREASPAERQLKFQDKTRLNKDLRLVTDPQGQTILLYAFLDQKNFVIATSEAAFAEIFERFVARGN